MSRPVAMHPDEVGIDATLVRRLLASQLPRWAELPLERVASGGTDHALFRLGPELAVRLPRIPRAVGQVESEARWLPRLGPRLPLRIPEPVARGVPGEGYPWEWSVLRWIPGETATPERIGDPVAAGRALGGFVAALQGIDAADGPGPGEANAWRGVPLAARDAPTREAIAELRGVLDADAATAAWEAALAAPAWDGPAVWVHGDLLAGNVLARRGRIHAVIDFGCLSTGDPACDVAAAWNLLPPQGRPAFRDASGADAASWARGRGWALSTALVGLPYYAETNSAFVRDARHRVAAVLEDPG